MQQNDKFHGFHVRLVHSGTGGQSVMMGHEASVCLSILPASSPPPHPPLRLPPSSPDRLALIGHQTQYRPPRDLFGWNTLPFRLCMWLLSCLCPSCFDLSLVISSMHIIHWWPLWLSVDQGNCMGQEDISSRCLSLTRFDAFSFLVRGEATQWCHETDCSHQDDKALWH